MSWTLDCMVYVNGGHVHLKMCRILLTGVFSVYTCQQYTPGCVCHVVCPGFVTAATIFITVGRKNNNNDTELLV